MKRSDKIFLTLMGASAVGWALDIGVSDGGPVGFVDVSQCVSAGNSQAACRRAYDDALRLHRAGAPRFSSSETCQTATDAACTPVQATDGRPATALLYVPALSAFKLRDNDCRPEGSRECGASGGGGSGGGFIGSASRRGDPLYEARSQAGSYRELGGLSRVANGRPGPATIRSVSVSRGGFSSFRGLRVGG